MIWNSWWSLKQRQVWYWSFFSWIHHCKGGFTLLFDTFLPFQYRLQYFIWPSDLGKPPPSWATVWHAFVVRLYGVEMIPSLCCWWIIKNGQSGSLPALIVTHFAFCNAICFVECVTRLWGPFMQHLNIMCVYVKGFQDPRETCGEIRIYGLALWENKEKTWDFSQH